MAKFTVVTACKNAARYIEETTGVRQKLNFADYTFSVTRGAE